MEPEIECPNCKNIYHRRKLNCPSCNHIGISKLYKYLPFNNHSLSLIIEKKIWCPKAKTLNDPFEFYFHLTDTNIAGIPIKEHSLKTAQDEIKELGIICLSEIKNDILMWSHYANGHTGFCIEFERHENNDLGQYDHCLPVTYDTIEVPSFDSLSIQERVSTAKIVTTKAPSWSYEKEWRLIIEHTSSNNLLPIPAKITSVIFGCKMTDAKRRIIANILRDDISYFETIQMKDKFGLDIKQILRESII